MSALCFVPPSIEEMNQNYVLSENFLSKKENRRERKYTLGGVKLISVLNVSILSPFGVRERYVNIPDCSNLFQKVVAYLILQAKIANFARRENQWIGYAFSGQSAKDIFTW